MNQNTRVRIGLVATVAAVIAGGSLAAAPAIAATPSCATAWTAGTAYSGGATVSENGSNYTANWWTQGDDPATHAGATGSGQPWTSTGACSGTGGGTTPPGGGTTTPGTGGSGGTASGLVFSPYKDITVNLDWNTNVMNTAVTGTRIPVVGSSNSLVSTREPGLKAITLAFATGTCGSENWGGVAADAFANANIPKLDAAGVNYIVSTGGAAGSFKCSGAALQSFIARYATPHMIGVDFDIESGQSAADVQNLVSAAALAQAKYPGMRFSFTLATLAASDGSYGGLNSTGDATVKAIKASTLTNYTINLMTMDFGRATAANCVLSGSTCQMGKSSIQAVTNLQHTYGIASSKIEVTPMIGVNDTTDEVFTLADVDTLSAYAKANGLAGIHYWSLDRDTPCASSTASSTCSSVPSAPALAWTDRFLADLK
ncbi:MULTISPECIES: carbohydrate-binding protein [unclassified Curtobacterium]|uniref:carbohydrate-binding protein n=1 Tax=unclassified Curtobacterium TaxID=257496 RepID=UPI000FA9B5F7|nr:MULTISPECIES: carbohydrate-binding protein [unclassified Curtobacterium]ROQ17234.1 carbohydrate binding protein [Curtobacterium sp. PhB171]ROQ29522.1 carbohydrate binding protein [Curtobacterium sp. PhB170]ROS45333.1 carbohydrate binding protein [Curtobacterium sp. PhB131]ROS65959.1 carbohydrate binding protein [Curtobacterium sp. PhB141]